MLIQKTCHYAIKNRFPFKSFHISLTISKPSHCNTYTEFLFMISQVVCHANLSAIYLVMRICVKTYAGKCILCYAGIAIIWQSWGCKWLQSNGTRRSINWKVGDGKTFRHHCDNLFCLWFVNCLNFVDWRNLLRNFESPVDFSLYLCNIPCPYNRECISVPWIPQLLVLHPICNCVEVETCEQQLLGTYSCCFRYSADKLRLRGCRHDCLKVLQLNLSHLNWQSLRLQ